MKERHYFRIQQEIHLEHKIITQSEAMETRSPCDTATHTKLIEELHKIEKETSQTLSVIAEKDRHTANYLRSINKRIDLLTQLVVTETDKPQKQFCKTIDLSEGGLRFINKESLEKGSYLALKLMLPLSHIGLLVFAQVIKCNDNNTNGFVISVEFINLQAAERAQLARFVVKTQAEQRREMLVHKNSENAD